MYHIHLALHFSSLGVFLGEVLGVVAFSLVDRPHLRGLVANPCCLSLQQNLVEYSGVVRIAVVAVRALVE